MKATERESEKETKMCYKTTETHFQMCHKFHVNTESHKFVIVCMRRVATKFLIAPLTRMTENVNEGWLLKVEKKG